MKPVVELMSAVTSILRYVASGFVAMAAYIFLYEKPLQSFEKGSWYYLLLTASIGLLTYAFHIAWLDKVFYRCISWWVNRGSTKNENAQLNMEIKESGRGLMFALASQTYLRVISDDRQVNALQNELEKRLALNCFLYCSLYQIGAILVYAYFRKMSIFKLEFQLLSALFLLMLVFAIRFNLRICRREAWVVSKFYQQVPSQILVKSVKGVQSSSSDEVPSHVDPKTSENSWWRRYFNL